MIGVIVFMDRAEGGWYLLMKGMLLTMVQVYNHQSKPRYVEDNSCSEAGSSSAGSRATVPFASKEEKKEAQVMREYWEDGEGDVKEEYGENTRQGGNKIRSGETEEEYKRRNRVKHEVKQEVSCTPGWGSSYRRAGPRM